MFAPTTKNERVSGAFPLDEQFFFLVVLRVASVWLCTSSKQQNVGRPTKAVVIVPAKCIFFLRI